MKRQGDSSIIKFNAKKLAAVAIAHATEETSRYFYGVYFYGKYAVATNGDRITIAYDPDSEIEESGLYPISKQALKAMCHKTATNVVIGRGNLRVCNDEGYSEPCRRLVWSFLDYYEDATPAWFCPAWFSPDIRERVFETMKILAETHQINATK